MVVSPTYFGACADVAGLAEVAHERGVPLAVDEAWGAHLRFHPDLPPDALSCGADVVVSSTHKIVGSLTQAAMLHLGEGGRIDEAVVDRCVSLVETTSPSALLSGSLDAARRLASVHGERLLDETLAGIAATHEAIEEIPGLAVLDDSMVGRAGIAGWDPLRARDRRARHRLDRLPAGEDSPSSSTTRSTSSSPPRTSSSRSSASASRRRSPASGWSPPCASPSAGSARASRSSRRSRWRRRRPGASWR